jgi:alkylhydroperoxidase family enzyme
MQTALKKERSMGLIQVVDPQSAQGEIKEAFDFFEKTIGTIPAPMAMFSASPALFKMQLQSLTYFMQHPTLSFALLSSIRYLVAEQYDYRFCTGFNKSFLEKQGLSEEDIQKMSKDPESAPLDDKERAMLVFVVKAVKAPASMSSADMDRLHAAGWTDSDALDAMMHAATMIASSVLMKTFQMDMAC